jgi:hypothetical protein
MQKATTVVNGVVLRENVPAVVPSGMLYCWTKYCVGERRGDNYRYGAVKPPNPEVAWFPAAINPDTILIATTRTFPSPEEAVSWLQSAGQTSRARKRPSPRQKARGSRR